MKSDYPDDLIDGRAVPPLVVEGGYVLAGAHRGSVVVEEGHLELRGTLQGSLSIHPGATATISGRQQGSVHVAAGAVVTVTGAIEGSTVVAEQAELVIEPGGKLAGSLHNDGRVIVRGVIGGSRSGRGDLLLQDEGTVKQPMARNGVNYYEW